MGNVTAVCGDAGGAHAVGPVLRDLRQNARHSVRALAYGAAGEIWKQGGIPNELLSSEVDAGVAEEMLRHRKTDLLLSGTSFNDLNLEKTFIAAARKAGLPSLSVLDFWSNYRLRFADSRGGLSCLPDRIAVMDELARSEMLAAGFEAHRIVVTGQPAFDDLRRSRDAASGTRESVRAALGVRSGELLVLFASQPIASLFGDNRAAPLFPGYTEHTVTRSLIAALRRIARRRDSPILLLVRPHPRQQPPNFACQPGTGLRIAVSSVGAARDVCFAADVVAGMSTVLLLEAAYMGCLVLSLQPGLRSRDALPTNRTGLTPAVYDEQDVEPVLERLLFDPEARAAALERIASLPAPGGAASRVVSLIEHMLSLKRSPGIAGSLP